MQNPLKILVVDDDALDRRAVIRAVHECHPEAVIQEATSCYEATQALELRSFDCVFLDHHFPDGNGVAWLRGVRDSGDTTPVVLLTGYGGEKLAVEAIRAGATDYLSKAELTPQILDRCLWGALRFHASQEQIRQAQEEIHLRDRAIAAASNGIIICDPFKSDCPIIYCNPAFSAMTGYSSEEILGHNCRFLQGEDTDGQAVQQVRDSLKETKKCLVVMKNYRKDGTPWWNELTISPVRDAGGRLTHFIGIQTDISERRDAEDALRQNVARQQAVLRDMFASVTEGKLILCAGEEDLPIRLTSFASPLLLTRTEGIRELRRCALSACRVVGMSDERRDDLESAVGEAAMNAVVHATTGIGHVFTSERGTVQVRVDDGGKGISVADLPKATLRRGYSTAGTLGHGFKMILQTVDRVHLLTGAKGTTVVLEQERDRPPDLWQ